MVKPATSKYFKRLEQIIADEIIELSYAVIETMKYQLASYHYETQLLVDLWVSPAAKALKPLMGDEYEYVKRLLVDSTKQAWSTPKFVCNKSDTPLLIIRSKISKNLKEVILLAEQDFKIKSNILVLSHNELLPPKPHNLF